MAEKNGPNQPGAVSLQEVREQALRRMWYAHDARWFMAVAAECGLAVANRLNRAVVREVGRLEALRLLAATGSPAPRDLSAFLALLETGRAWFVPPELIDMRLEQEGEGAYQVSVARCFVAENVARAGIAGEYECGVFDRMAGWHEALELPLSEAPAALRCALAAGRPCERRLVVAAAGAGSPRPPKGQTGVESDLAESDDTPRRG